MKKLALCFSLFCLSCVLPAMAQVKTQGTHPRSQAAGDTSLGQQVERAVVRAQAANNYANTFNPADVREDLLYRAEELLQADRNAHEGNPQHTLDYYYNQLLQEEGQAPQRTQPPAPPYHPNLVEGQDPYLLYRAEELLQQDRNAHSGNARHTLRYYLQQLLEADE